MNLKLIEKKYIKRDAPYYHGTTEQQIYECPCGKGTIVYEDDDIPGNRDRYTRIECKECAIKYEIKDNLSTHWKIVEK